MRHAVLNSPPLNAFELERGLKAKVGEERGCKHKSLILHSALQFYYVPNHTHFMPLWIKTLGLSLKHNQWPKSLTDHAKL